MKYLFYLNLTFLFFGCRQKDPYLLMSFANENIPLEQIKNYGELKDLIEILDCEYNYDSISFYKEKYNITQNNNLYDQRNMFQISLSKKGYHLPLYVLNCGQEFKLKRRNIYQIHHGTPHRRKELKAFITNNNINPKYSEKPQKASFIFKFEREMELTEFEKIATFLVETYHSLWREKAIELYEIPFQELSNEQKEAIITIYPVNVSLKTNESFWY